MYVYNVSTIECIYSRTRKQKLPDEYRLLFTTHNTSVNPYVTDSICTMSRFGNQDPLVRLDKDLIVGPVSSHKYKVKQIWCLHMCINSKKKIAANKLKLLKQSREGLGFNKNNPWSSKKEIAKLKELQELKLKEWAEIERNKEEDARKQVEDEVHSGNYKHFLRENTHDFVNYSQIGSSDYWWIYEITDEDRIYIDER